jgi:NitT/TauT family transport system ATP-binding protein
MQQRVQIARCLAQRPELLMMDEPFGALDAMTRESLQDEVSRLVREQGLTVLFVTHDLEEAIYLGDRVIALRANPTPEAPSLAAVIDVPIPRPRDQLTTKEHPDFLRLRRELYRFLGHH